MAIPNDLLYVSVEEYLAFEKGATARHEFVDGQAFAMVGTSLRHNIISSNLQALLQAVNLEIHSLLNIVRLTLDAIYEGVDWGERNASAPWIVSETADESLELEEIS